jgi:hypothetical protein
MTDFNAVLVTRPAYAAIYEGHVAKSYNAVRLFDRVSQETVTINVSSQQNVYYQRAYDDGTAGYVYWLTEGAPNPTPLAIETQPNYTGALSVFAIVSVSRSS